VLIDQLLKAGAEVHVNDPVAIENVRHIFGDKLTYHVHHYDAVMGADCLAIVTEWNEYRTPDFDYMKLKMKSPVIFDGRNLYNPAKMTKAGFQYSGIGLFVPKS
jgi:UDPglucose 6-dehydrogenase